MLSPPEFEEPPRAQPAAAEEQGASYARQRHTASHCTGAASPRTRRRLIECQRHWMEIEDAIHADLDLKTILRRIHEAVARTGCCDRVEFFLYAEADGQIRGVYSSDQDGVLTEISGQCWTLTLREDSGPLAETARMLRGEVPYLLRPNFGATVPKSDPKHSVRDRAEIALRAGGRALGLVTLDNFAARCPITIEDIEVLLPFCQQAATAIYMTQLRAERDQTHLEVARWAQRDVLVKDMSRAIGSTLDPDEVMARVLAEVRRLGDFLRVSITRPTGASGEWQVVAAWNATTSPQWPSVGTVQITPPRLPIRVGSFLYYRPDAAHDGGVLSEELAALGVGSVLNVELWLEERCLGVLNLSRAGRDAFSAEECATLEDLTPAIALALHNADLYRSLKQAQEALIRAETLRAVGELASGVAHNLNNLLSVILGYIEMIQIELDDPMAVCHDAKIIQKAVLDGAEIVQRIQRFVHHSAQKVYAPVAIAELLREALELTRVKWYDEAIGRGAPIQIVRDLAPGLEVDGHGVELREVFVNLIRNACDAMPAGGTLTVRCMAQEQEVVVEVCDTGIGMDEATRRHVFEPFFTTKGIEHGLGLGLSASWSMVKQHQGTIEVQSAPGRGATFRVRLPRCWKAVKPDLLVKPACLSARVLWVEDEDIVREAVAQGLQRFGVTVQIAASGTQALTWLQETGAACDVVLTDHGMAAMTGLELLEEIRRSYPGVRRVLLSGWGAQPPGGVDLSAAEKILSKPITTPLLVEALRTLLQS